MWISEIQFTKGTAENRGRLSVKPGQVTVLVGPNSSGKSLALKEIEGWLNGEAEERKVVAEMSLTFPSYQELEQWLLGLGAVTSSDARHVKLHRPSFLGLPPEDSEMFLPEDILGWYSSLEGNEKAHREIRKRTTKWATLRLDALTRLKLIEERDMGSLQEAPANHLIDLFQNEPKRALWRGLCSDAFPEMHAALDHTSRKMRIRMGKRNPKIEEETGLGPAAVEYHRQAIPIDLLGDGVKAFTGLSSVIASYDWRYLLIDDPEAFLHPPIARRFGTLVANLAKQRGAQVFASTHSSYFLEGCLEGCQDVVVVRLTYDSKMGIAAGHALAANQLQQTIQNPLLRSTGVFDAMFHRAAVVTEGNTDRVFYETVSAMLPARHHECLFLSANSRDSVSDIVGPLRSLGIPTAAIVDFEFLYDGGSSWGKLLRQAGIEGLRKTSIDNEASFIRQGIDDAKIERELLQKKGVRVLPPVLREKAEKLLRKLGEGGLFCVPAGELESWFDSLNISGEGSRWLQTCLEKLTEIDWANYQESSGLANAWDFMRSVGGWLAPCITCEVVTNLAILIDQGYLEKVLQYCFDEPSINYRKLSRELCNGQEPCRIILYYCEPYHVPGATAEQLDFYRKKMAFLEALEHEGIEVRLGEIVKDPKRDFSFAQKYVVGTITADLVDMSLKGEITHFVLVTGNGEIAPAVSKAREAGAKVTLCYADCHDPKSRTRTTVDKALLDRCDNVRAIDYMVIEKARP